MKERFMTSYRFLPIVLLLCLVSCLMLMPPSVYALTTFNYEGDVTGITEYSETTRLTNAGFSLGDTFSITLQFDETAINTSTQDYLGNYSAIVDFTISNGQFTATGSGNGSDTDIIIFDQPSTSSSADTFEASLRNYSADYIEGLGEYQISLIFRGSSDAHDNTTFGLTGLPTEPLDPNNFSNAWATIRWSELVDYGTWEDWEHPYLSIGNLRVVNNSVPEPCTILLLGFGLIGLAGMRRKA